MSLLLFLSLFKIAPVFANQSTSPPSFADRGPLDKITFIHHKKGYTKSYHPGKTKPSVANCYQFLSSGAKWKTPEPYLVNPQNLDGLDSGYILSSMESAANEWEKYGGNIFLSGQVDNTAIYDQFDNKNSVQIGNYPDPNVIAITTIWGYFYGPPKTRELVEWDMLFNDNFSWGDAEKSSSLMDLQNIATHELGHSAGLNDLYETTCQTETMYGYSHEGEIIKRDLAPGDIAGIQKLY